MRLTDRVNQYVLDTLADVALGEEYDHEVVMAFQPSSAGPLPVIVLIITGRGVALDEVIGAPAVMLATPSPAFELVAEHVRAAVGYIRAERARQTASVPLLGTPR